MSDRRSYVALDWVNAQIAETLQQALEALEGFIANSRDITRLRFALTYLHQVSGSLFMLELHAATLLSKEMESLINAVLEKEHAVQPQIEAAKLIKSILPSITEYLDRVCKTHEDNPKELLGLINSVREANQQELVSEADLFNPDIAVARKAEQQQPAMAAEEFNDLIRKLRQSFQTGLIGVVRDKDLEANYALVSKVCASLHKASANTASEPLWHIAFAITEQLGLANVPADIETKKALKQIDSQIKHLEESGRDALAESPDSALLKALLYSVAKAETVTDAIVELRQIYQLDLALAESEAEPAVAEEAAASRKLVHAIIDSLRQELAQVAGFDLGEMHEAVTRMQNTLRIIGVSDLLASLQEIEQLIHAVIDEGGDIGSRAEPVCRQLEKIEAFLQAWQDRKVPVNTDDVAKRYTRYLADLRLDLDAIKQTLAEYESAGRDINLIHALPDLMERQAELLAISPLRVLLPVMEAVQEYIIGDLLDVSKKPVSANLQALAEAISSVDYYLERLPADSAENLRTIARVAEESVARMQAPARPDEEAVISTDEEVYDDYSEVPSASADEDEAIPVAVMEEDDRAADEDAVAFDILAGDVEDDTLQFDLPEDTEADTHFGLAEAAADEGDIPLAVAEISAEPVDEGEDELFVFAPGEDADEEILEIFIEEAREVVEHIREYLPQLEADYANMDALLEIRRSYHTLKGSGRMVGATHIGDYAWSVERMMNKVRDGLAKVTDNCISILHLATDGVPLLIDGLENGSGVSRRMMQNVINRADAEWEGRALEPVAVVAEEIRPEPEFGLAEEWAESESEEPLAMAEVLEELDSLEEMAEELGLVEVADQSGFADELPEEQETIDEELLAIFLAEAETHIKVLSDYLDNLEPGYEDILVTSELQRALHTLKGSSHMADVKSIAMLSTPLEGFVKDLNNFQTPVDAEIFAMLMRAREMLESQLARLQKGDMSFVPGIDMFIADIKALHASRIDKQEAEALVEEGFADKYTALLSAALDSLTEAADLIQEWQTEGITEVQQQSLIDALQRLANTAREAKYPEVADLAQALADFYIHATQQQTGGGHDFFTLANKGHDELDDMMNMIAAHQIVEPAAVLINELGQFGSAALPLAAEVGVEIPKPAVLADRSQLAQLQEQLLAADPDMLEIFTEEAGELLDALDGLMQEWFDNHKNRSGLNEIKRIIHTLKGGARLIDVQVLADVAHTYITTIETAEEKGVYDNTFFERVQQLQNQLAFDLEFFISGEYRKPLEAMPETAETDVPASGATGYEAPASEEAVAEEGWLDDLLSDELLADELAGGEIAEEEVIEAAGLPDTENFDVSDYFAEAGAEPLESLPAEPTFTTQDLVAEEPVADAAEAFADAIDNEFDEAFALAADGIEPPFAVAEAEFVDEADVDETESLGEFVADSGSEEPVPEAAAEVADLWSSEADTGDALAETAGAVEEEAWAPAASAPSAAAAVLPGTGRDDYLLLAEQHSKADQDTLEIFLEEALELDNELDEAVNEWLSDHEATQHAGALKRILHTLKGGARLAELSVLGDLTHNYESMIEHAEAHRAFDAAFFARMQAYLDQVHAMIEFVANGANPAAIPAIALAAPVVIAEEPALLPEVAETPVVAEVAEELAAADTGFSVPVATVAVETPVATADSALQTLAEQYRKADQDTLEIFLEEAQELDNELDEAVSAWLADREAVKHADALKRILHTLKGGARLAELSVLGDFTHDFESMIEHAEARKAFTGEFFASMQGCQDQVHRMIDFIARGAPATDIAAAPVMAVPVMTLPDADVTQPALEVSAPDQDIVVPVGEDIDADLLALFVEEAKEQNDGIEECIANFLKDASDLAPLEELKRLLHTLKGGARLTGLGVIGDLSHDFETFIINSEREKKIDSGSFVDEMQGFHDKLTKMIAGIKVAAPAPAVSQAEAVPKPESNVVPLRPAAGAPVGFGQDSLVSQAAIDATRTFIENFNKDQQQRGNREPVKIAPDLLEDLINLAGENSIGRSRIEEQMNEIIISQGEMDATVDRLHSQLRRLEIETEAQIVFRQEQVVSEGQENFDPLEMDRYTQMQQLSKSLIESASDLDDISATFTNKLRDMETLLLQQARINTELQEGLMRCQMVPFSRMVPRLRRIVRQVAQELGKKVEFDVENAEGELDRTILERMVAPLEHMLRNAVDHGIEMPDVRRAAGKPEQGTIILALGREGGEIVLTLRDNGAGVNIAAVRKKAIERGLMLPDANLSDHELAKFILHAGFSTAQKVTQISGRGVGMDVVYNEIKQMGGSLDINSRQGEGSVFTVRLPFTVSVNRALMVMVGTETYAIPLNSIEGIVRVSPYELEAYYQPDAPMFEYAGQSYHLRYMGGLLRRGQQAKLEGLTIPLPVVLIRSSDYSVAVQVDRLVGSREVVVKSLGPQFSMVGGLSGATVLGDGSVVVILDVLALIRTDFALGLALAGEAAEEYKPEPVRKQTTVMVVDDSVTVRKVTSRLLERFGLRVILAKDGLDALTQLQEMDELPDVMLLDIEMPRMDGFEVVSRVRHDTRLQHIPITMITSRTGEKHRERALALGASRYLGKPYQERELLQTISELTGAEIQQA